MSNLWDIRQRNTLRRYLNKQMKDSLIAGVPEIVKCKSRTRRYIKSIMFLLCTVGLFYQTYTFLESFLKYETIQNFRLEYPSHFMAPAVTFCNKNRINRELFCAEFPEECMWYKNREEICRDRPKLCMSNLGPSAVRNFGVPKNISQKYLNQSNAFLDTCGPQSPWEYIYIAVKTNCQREINGGIYFCKRNDSVLIQAPSGGLPYKCFSLFSLFDKPDEEPKEMSIFDGYKFLIHTHPDFLIDDKDNVQLYMYVHDPRHLGNPISDGIMLNTGYSYILSFTMDCIELCKIERMVEQNSCVEKSITYPHRFPICSEINSISDKIFEDCSSGCREACEFTLYKTAVQHPEKFTASEGVIKLAIKFSQMSVQKIFMEPKFQNIELFSYIGGFMGMWLGICIVTFVDFLETVTDVLIFALMKWKKMHEKKKTLRLLYSKMPENSIILS